MKYENYIFDLYGTLVDIHTDEEKTELWEKLAQFYGYYGAVATGRGTEKRVCVPHEGQKKDALRQEMGSDAAMKKTMHMKHPEIEIEEVFLHCFRKKGTGRHRTCHSCWTVFPDPFHRIYQTL